MFQFHRDFFSFFRFWREPQTAMAEFTILQNWKLFGFKNSLNSQLSLSIILPTDSLLQVLITYIPCHGCILLKVPLRNWKGTGKLFRFFSQKDGCSVSRQTWRHDFRQKIRYIAFFVLFRISCWKKTTPVLQNGLHGGQILKMPENPPLKLK